MDKQKKEKRRKKFFKANFKKGIRGSISILLCLLMTPFLTIALGLVEYSRYQQVLEITNEIYELTGISVLADYDQYIHNRFGLLATTQESDFTENGGALLENNAHLLGNQITLADPSIAGGMSLNDTDILRKQVLDFSELTVSTSVLAEDFNLEALLQKLNGMKGLTDFTNTLTSVTELTDALSTAVDELKDLQNAANAAQKAINTARDSAKTLATDLADLYKKLAEDGITLPENATREEIEAAVSAFAEDYRGTLESVYKSAKELIDDLETVKTELGDLWTAIGDFKTAVEDAREAVNKLGENKSNEVDPSGGITTPAASVLESALIKMEDLIKDTLDNIKNNAIETAKQAVNDIISQSLESMGLADAAERYQEILSGDYFSSPMTETAKQDIIDLLKTAHEVYNSGDPSKLVDLLKDKFLPDINIDFDELGETIGGVLEEATTALQGDGDDEFTTLLTKLMNLVEGLFDLNVFFDPKLSANVNLDGQSDGGYQDFLTAVSKLFTAIKGFKVDFKEDNLFEMFKKVVNAIGDLIESIGAMVKAIVKIIGEKFKALGSLVAKIGTLNGGGLYETLLISAYMTHNLPCRLNDGEWTYDGEANQGMVELTGSGLIPGFSYNDIARPAKFSGQDGSLYNGSFAALAGTLTSLYNGEAKDTMFNGAELEYVYAGTQSELANQIIAFLDIYFLRLILGLPAVFSDTEVNGIAAAANIASWAVYIIYILAEPFCDTVLLVNKQKVPMIKTRCWLTPTNVTNFVTTLGEGVLNDSLSKNLNEFMADYEAEANKGSDDGAMGSKPDSGGFADAGYETHMLILLIISVSDTQQLERLKTLIRLETSEYYRQKDMSFDMSKTYTTVDISANVTFKPFFDFGAANGSSPFIPAADIKKTLGY